MTMSGFVAKWCTGIGKLQIKQLSHETNIFLGFFFENFICRFGNKQIFELLLWNASQV